MRKPRLLVVCANDADVTSFYRGLGPLSQLEKTHPEFEILFHWGPFDFNPNRLRLADILFVQRPVSKSHFDLIKTARDFGLKVWVDLDDDVFDIPESNPAHMEYKTNSYPHYASGCLQMADVVTTTTPFLANVLSGHTKAKMRVISNALDEMFIPHRQEPRWPRKDPIVCWRGSTTHHGDLLPVAETFKKLSQKYSEWRWVFIGDKPWFIEISEELYGHAGWNDNIMGYMQLLTKTSPTIIVNPLVDHAFNRSKSNNAWIEAAYAGAVMLAPDWEEWQRPGVVTYGDFEPALEELMNADKFQLRRHCNEAWDYVKENLLLSKVNELRLDVIRSLTTSS